MSDLISRKAAIDAVHCRVELANKIDAMAMTSAIAEIAINIASLPSAEAVQGWIPCSERLPEIEREGQRRGWYITTNGYGCVSLTQYEFYHDFLKTGWQSDIQIVAWMPLPEPYKGGE